MTQFLDTEVNKTPGANGEWTDTDLSANIPVGATGAIFHVNNYHATTQANYGLRMKGSTDSFYLAIRAFSHTYYMVGVDGDRKCQLQKQNAAVRFNLVGYTESDAVFFENAKNYSLGTINAWTDIDLSTDLPAGALAAIFNVQCLATAPRMWGLRKNGSSDDRYQDCSAIHQICSIMGVDSNRKVEGKIETTLVDFLLLGYLTAGAANTNAVDNSLSSTGTYIDITETNAPAGATGVYVEMSTAILPYNFAARKNGTTGGVYYTPALKKHLVAVGLDANKKWEGKIENAALDFFTVGYFVAGGGTPSAQGTIIG